MNTILYISIMLLGIPLRIISAILYPIVFLFRCKVLLYMSKRVTEDEDTILCEYLNTLNTK